jgi:signal transduction histidine kinase
VPRAAGFATVPAVGWKVWVSQPVADLRSELTPLIVSTVEWGLIAIVLALVLGFLGAAWITRPVDELTGAAARIAQGDFITPVKVRERYAARELRALATTFNQMTSQLSGAYQTLEEKVSQRTSELQAANQELARANKLKSEFLANVSHELRTPLSAIIGFSQILLDGIDGPVNEEQQQDIQQVNKSGQSLLGLINQILDLSKIEAGKMDLSLERVELPGLISSVLESISPLAQEKGLRIDTRFAPSLPAVEADSVRLKQILINLLSNAVKFTERGHIEVSAQPSGRMVRIAVKDTGTGISPESQKLIFDEFVQGDGSSTRPEHRAPPRRDAWWSDHGGQRARTGKHLHLYRYRLGGGASRGGTRPAAAAAPTQPGAPGDSHPGGGRRPQCASADLEAPGAGGLEDAASVERGRRAPAGARGAPDADHA